ncbi:MAG: flagellar basal body rod protein FlgC [Candidatus Melainabacteria bacterium]|nr:flagellar basal body rod protein FlgC [Candidatus Melainabacteria bacterium]
MDVFDITASALTGQRMRLDTIASNLANVNTTRKADGSVGAYRRRQVSFAPMLDEASQGLGLSGSVPIGQALPMKPTASGLSMGPNGRPLLTAHIASGNPYAAGVKIMGIQEDQETPMRKVYEPGHPDADENGFVEMPNINLVSEMVDMISASRAYEANVTAFQSAKSMMQSALEM